MPQPYEQRRRVRRDAVRRTRDLAKARPWSKDPAEQEVMAQSWADDVAALYDVPAPAVLIDGMACHFNPAERIVHLDRFSIVSLAHEVRHALQHAGATGLPAWATTAPGGGAPGMLLREDDARAWSLSLFRLSCPRRFERFAAEGRIEFVNPAPYQAARTTPA